MDKSEKRVSNTRSVALNSTRDRSHSKYQLDMAIRKGSTKRNREQKRKIEDMVEAGLKHKHIADLYRIPRNTVKGVIERKKWLRENSSSKTRTEARTKSCLSKRIAEICS